METAKTIFEAAAILYALYQLHRLNGNIAEQNSILLEQTTKANARLSRTADAMETVASCATRAQASDEARASSSTT